MRTAIALLAALTLPLAAPAAAKNDKTPPGNPCGKGNGNPCNGNNGNAGSQGDAGGRNNKMVEGAAPPFEVNAPAFDGRSVFITQIGSFNRAVATQTAVDARVEIRQEGDANRAEATQRGTGPAYAAVTQTGDGHVATVEQQGVGRSSLYVQQGGGDRNQAFVAQNTTGALYNGAVLAQSGFDNAMSLRQDGQDNRALLSQEGDGNRMTAVQMNEGNRLAWVQQGDGLADLQIMQSGRQSLAITQTNGK